MKYLDWFNKFYGTPRDLIDFFYNIFYKEQVEELNKQYDDAKKERKFIIDEDGNVSFNADKFEEVLRKNIDVMNKIRDERIH